MNCSKFEFLLFSCDHVSLKLFQEVSSVDMEKRLAVISCQLRKTESAKKTYEVAAQKLLQFVEV